MFTYVNHQAQAAEEDGSFQQVRRRLYNLTRYAARSEDVVCADSIPGTIERVPGRRSYKIQQSSQGNYTARS
jgi:hypothetical protein